MPSTNTTATRSARALSYLPTPEQFGLGPDDYLEHIRKVKEAVDVPVIASLNGTSVGGWLAYGRMIEDAGADALELNTYELVTEPEESAGTVEKRISTIAAKLTEELGIPMAMKLGPYFTSLPSFARSLQHTGIRGLVLFNRFYQADIDSEELVAVPSLRLSTPGELPLRLNWLAVLSARVDLNLAASGGVHSAVDAVKAVMAGAHAVQVVSALLQHGPEYLRKLITDFDRWLEEHEYDSVDQMRGSMNLDKTPDPHAYERGNYMKILKSWRPGID